MSGNETLSKRTLIHWLINASVFLSGTITALSGICFLFLPSAGYQGGRNATYGMRIFFDRSTWDALHTWSGVSLVILIAVHVSIHWDWIKRMVERVLICHKSNGAHLSTRSRRNLILNALMALSFIISAISGTYFLFVIKGGFQGARNLLWEPGFLWSRRTWDLIHAWGGVIIIELAMLHLGIHWGWIKKVTTCLFRFPESGSASAAFKMN